MRKDEWKEFYKQLFPYCYGSFLDLADEWESIAPKPKSVVYVLNFSNDTVKIGVTQDIERRKKTLCGMSGLKIKREWNTDLLERGIAYKIEKFSHDELNPQRTQGEFFAVPFDDACFTVALYTIIVCEGERLKHERRKRA